MVIAILERVGRVDGRAGCRNQERKDRPLADYSKERSLVSGRAKDGEDGRREAEDNLGGLQLVLYVWRGVAEDAIDEGLDELGVGIATEEPVDCTVGFLAIGVCLVGR